MLKKPPPRAPDGLNLLSGVHPEQKNQQATSVRQSHLHTISRSSKMHIQNSLYFPKDALTTMPWPWLELLCFNSKPNKNTTKSNPHHAVHFLHNWTAAALSPGHPTQETFGNNCVLSFVIFLTKLVEVIAIKHPKEQSLSLQKLQRWILKKSRFFTFAGIWTTDPQQWLLVLCHRARHLILEPRNKNSVFILAGWPLSLLPQHQTAIFGRFQPSVLAGSDKNRSTPSVRPRC